MFDNTTAGRIVERRANVVRPLRCPKGCEVISSRSMRKNSEAIENVDFDEIMSEHMREVHSRKVQFELPPMTESEWAESEKTWEALLNNGESNGPFLNEPPF